LFNYIRPYKKHLFAAVVFMMFFAVFSVVSIGTLAPVIDKVFVPEDSAHFSLPVIGSFTIERVRALRLLALFIIIVMLLKGLSGFGHTYLMQFISASVVQDIRSRLYGRVLRLSPAFFNKRKTGELLSRFTNDITVIQHTVTEGFAHIIREPVTILGFMALLFYLNAGLAVVSLIILPPIALLIKYLGEKVRKKTTYAQEKISGVSSIIQETLWGMRVVQAFGMEEYEQQRFDAAGREFLRAVLKSGKYYLMSSPIMEFLGAAGIAVILVYAGYRVAPGADSGMTAGRFITFLAAVFSMYTPAKNLTRANNMLQQARAASGRVFELMDEEPDVVEKPDAVIIPGLQKEIEFKDVSFSYDGETPVLRNINFRARKGMVIAVVGASGAGKTTLVNLIPRFYDVTGGSVSIDGTDIRDASISSLRGQIGLVTQEVILFNDTVANNISYGNPDISMDRIFNAAAAANAESFIKRLKGGYNAVVGERGVSLSGGQRQRIAIARAVLKDPAVLIFDEATSALDSESESQVQSAMEELMKDRTVFVIAHRLSTVKNADRILVLDGGMIVEEGVHGGLLEKRGVYNRLYEMQFQT
jgi:ATP-binding cassette, subfamily B, bacterial MsbA